MFGGFGSDIVAALIAIAVVFFGLGVLFGWAVF